MHRQRFPLTFLALFSVNIRICIPRDSERDPLNAHNPAAATRTIGSEDLSTPGSKSMDEADGWFLLGPLVITKGILAKGVRVLLEQRQSIQKIGNILRNIYHRCNRPPTSPDVFLLRQIQPPTHLAHHYLQKI